MFKNPRKVHVDGKEYLYTVGRSSIGIATPDGRQIFPSHSEVSGLSWDEIKERSRIGNNFAFTPLIIKVYIVAHIHERVFHRFWETIENGNDVRISKTVGKYLTPDPDDDESVIVSVKRRSIGRGS